MRSRRAIEMQILLWMIIAAIGVAVLVIIVARNWP